MFFNSVFVAGNHPEERSARPSNGYWLAQIPYNELQSQCNQIFGFELYRSPTLTTIATPIQKSEKTLANSRVFVTGHQGMVGSAIVRCLQGARVEHLLTKARNELDLLDQACVNQFFAEQRPEVVLFASAKVGGIHANNTFPADFIHQNLVMATNTIHAAYEHGCRRFLFLGSTCIYPRLAPQPMPEDCLLTGPLESTNEAYALAKICGLKMCQFYRRQYGVTFHSAMPTNLYGPGDNYHPDNSHVLPGLIRRFHEAKQRTAKSVSVWGSGRPRREFLHVDDLARAVVHLAELENPPDWVNVGTGTDITIAELAALVAETVGYQGSIDYDSSKPDGTPVKRTDIRLIESTGWRPTITLADGIKQTYRSFQDEWKRDQLREV